jgi:hypothetical protein
VLDTLAPVVGQVDLAHYVSGDDAPHVRDRIEEAIPRLRVAASALFPAGFRDYVYGEDFRRFLGTGA